MTDTASSVTRVNVRSTVGGHYVFHHMIWSTRVLGDSCFRRRVSMMPPSPAATATKHHEIKSELPGTFYTRPAPDKPEALKEQFHAPTSETELAHIQPSSPRALHAQTRPVSSQPFPRFSSQPFPPLRR